SEAKAALAQATASLEAADAQLQKNIDATDLALQDTQSRLEAADSQLQAGLDAADATLAKAKADLEQADSTLQSSLNDAKAEIEGEVARVESGYQAGDRANQASIKILEHTVASVTQVIAKQIEQLSATYNTRSLAESATTDAKITETKQVLADADKALAEALTALEVAYQAADASLNGSISSLAQTIANENQVLSQRIDTVTADYKSADSALSGTVSSLQKAVADGDSALSERIDTAESEFKAANNATSASITELGKTVAREDAALSERINTVDAGYKSADAALSGSISSLSETVASNDSAISKRIDNVEAAFQAADAETNSQVSSLSETLASGDQALAKRIDSVESGYKTADTATNASVTELSETVTNNESAASSRMDGIEAEFKAADNATNAAVTGLSKTVTDNKQAIASRVDDVEADYKAKDTELAGSVSSLSQVVVDNKQAISSRVDSVEAEFRAADNATNASVSSLAETVADEDQALSRQIESVKASHDDLAGSVNEQTSVDAQADKIIAMQLSQLDAAYKARSGAESATTDAKITETQKTLAEADQALAQTITELETNFRQVDAETNASLVELTKTVVDNEQAFTTRLDSMDSAYKAADAANKASIDELAETTASADQALANKTTALETTVNGPDGLSAKVETNASAISTMDSEGSQAHKALWETKASVGDISAGIGLVVDDTGKSQAVVSASQFFVYDPNQPNTVTPLFAIDNGKVIIPDTLIEAASIRILNAQEITAKNIVASATITTPNLEGATGSFEDVISSRGTFNDAKVIRAIIENATIAGTLAAKNATIEDVTIHRATISGTLVSVDGTFTGTVQVGNALYVDENLVRINSSKVYITDPTDGSDLPLLVAQDGKLVMPHVTVNQLDVASTASIADNQAVFNAERFYVYGGNGATPQLAFAVVDGKVVIAQLLVKDAVIQTLESETVIADEVKANTKLTSPVIEGGELRGGNAGFGAGGPYAGYHSYINDDGVIYTDNIRARGHIEATSGEFKGHVTSALITASTIYGVDIIGGSRKYTTDPYGNGAMIYYQHLYIPPENTQRLMVSCNPYVTAGASQAPVVDRTWSHLDLHIYSAADTKGHSLGYVTYDRFRWLQIPPGSVSMEIKSYCAGDDNVHEWQLQLVDRISGVVLHVSGSYFFAENYQGLSGTVQVGNTVFNWSHKHSNGYWLTNIWIGSRQNYGSPWDQNLNGFLRLRYKVHHANSANRSLTAITMSASVNNEIRP
ncbi:DUF1983 domain-containing protein, partial [Photobacterium sp. OFAV2-7]|uniref:phage tail tip fiber protein n=1 Tax=Photobacterium sp. OFAV2-7 TaxID=2917748 RepID=UPI001EF48C6C